MYDKVDRPIIRIELQDTEWPFEYTSHDREMQGQLYMIVKEYQKQGIRRDGKNPLDDECP